MNKSTASDSSSLIDSDEQKSEDNEAQDHEFKEDDDAEDREDYLAKIEVEPYVVQLAFPQHLTMELSRSGNEEEKVLDKDSVPAEVEKMDREFSLIPDPQNFNLYYDSETGAVTKERRDVGFHSGKTLEIYAFNLMRDCLYYMKEYAVFLKDICVTEEGKAKAQKATRKLVACWEKYEQRKRILLPENDVKKIISIQPCIDYKSEINSDLRNDLKVIREYDEIRKEEFLTPLMLELYSAMNASSGFLQVTLKGLISVD